MHRQEDPMKQMSNNQERSKVKSVEQWVGSSGRAER